MRKSIIFLFLWAIIPLALKPMKRTFLHLQSNFTRRGAITLSSIALSHHGNCSSQRQPWQSKKQFYGRLYSITDGTNSVESSPPQDWWNYFDETLQELQSLPSDIANDVKIIDFKHKLLKKIIEDKLYYQDQRFEEYLRKNPFEIYIGLQYATHEDEITHLIKLVPETCISPQYFTTNMIDYYGKNEYIDAYIFKSLLPLKQGHTLSLSSEKRKEIIIRITSKYKEDTTVINRINYALKDLLADNSYAIAKTFLEYTFYENKITEFVELLELGADPDRVICKILNSHAKRLAPHKLIFLKTILNYKPSLQSFKDSLEFCSEEEFKLFLEANYHQDNEFIKKVYEIGNHKQIAMLQDMLGKLSLFKYCNRLKITQ